MISVIMPAYNAAPFIGEAIESIVCQTYGDFELLVLDDGSTDNTREIARRFAVKDSRVQVVSYPNEGLANSLNRGLRMARHDWVATLHADDVAMPNRLERQRAFVQANPDIAVASTWVYNIDARGRVIGKGCPRWTSRAIVEEVVRKGEFIGFHHSPVILRKEIILREGGYRQDFVPSEDFDLWNRLLEHGHMVLVQPEFLLKYRIHGESASVAKARLIRQKARWVKQCAYRRRQGQPEPDWNEFISESKQRPMLQRLNEDRKDTAKILYKNAVFAFASRHYFRMMWPFLGGLLLQPGYMLREAFTKIAWKDDE